MDSSGSNSWYLTDRLGTVRDRVDASNGNVLNHVKYSSFGEVTYQSNSNDTDRFKFTGREYDMQTKLSYHRGRYLDTPSGRWTSEDPIGFAAGDFNLYRYVGNSATNYVDPSGLLGDDPRNQAGDLDAMATGAAEEWDGLIWGGWYNPVNWVWGPINATVRTVDNVVKTPARFEKRFEEQRQNGEDLVYESATGTLREATHTGAPLAGGTLLDEELAASLEADAMLGSAAMGGYGPRVGVSAPSSASARSAGGRFVTPAYQSFFKEVKELVDSFASGPLASKVIDWTRMGRVIEFLKKQHIKLVRDMSEEMAREFARRSNSEVLPRAVFSLTNKGEMTIFLRPDATYYDIIHEIGHWVSFRATLAKTDGNWKAAFELWKKASPEMRERAVYRWMRAKFWDKLSDAEKRDANYQAFTRFGKKPPPD